MPNTHHQEKSLQIPSGNSLQIRIFTANSMQPLSLTGVRVGSSSISSRFREVGDADYKSLIHKGFTAIVTCRRFRHFPAFPTPSVQTATKESMQATGKSATLGGDPAADPNRELAR